MTALPGIFKAESDDALRPRTRNPGCCVSNLEAFVEGLDPGVESFGVLAKQCQINVVERRLNTRE